MSDINWSSAKTLKSTKWVVDGLSLLDDGSPTSTNLGNDHVFISEEY